ncbi:MAG TPA: hypothetical protein VG146_15365 [Verrucomicrobiae bacterium]|nr:hypothetical protein [Verrucomicrobiae bacterium]
MKAIFCLPAHPSYFEGHYTQEEIDQAIQDYDRLVGGIIFKGYSEPKVRQEFLLLREPGKTVTVIFDSAGYGEGKQVSGDTKARGISQYRETSYRDLQTHVQNLKNTLEANRGNFQSGS